MKYWYYDIPENDIFSKLKCFLILEEVLNMSDDEKIDLTDRSYQALCRAQIMTLEQVVKLIEEMEKE